MKKWKERKLSVLRDSRTNEFVTFEINSSDIGIYWVGEKEETKMMEWWGEPDRENEYSYTSGHAALKLA